MLILSLPQNGFDEKPKTFWNNDWWNHAKYNAGTPWHDLMGMMEYSATYGYDELQTGDWNTPDWNAAEQAAAILGMEEVLEQVGIFGGGKEEEEEAVQRGAFRDMDLFEGGGFFD